MGRFRAGMVLAVSLALALPGHRRRGRIDARSCSGGRPRFRRLEAGRACAGVRDRPARRGAGRPDHARLVSRCAGRSTEAQRFRRPPIQAIRPTAGAISRMPSATRPRRTCACCSWSTAPRRGPRARIQGSSAHSCAPRRGASPASIPIPRTDGNGLTTPGRSLPRVRLWQIWDAPNGGVTLPARGAVARYRRMLRAAAQALRRVARDNVVVGAATADRGPMGRSASGRG